MSLLLLSFLLSSHVMLTDTQMVGETYSCFSGFESISTEFCGKRVGAGKGAYEQTGLSDSPNSDFCVSGPTYGKTEQGSFGKSRNYVAFADMRVTDLGKFSTSYGYLGLAFNMIDNSNYDVLYARPHANDFCWELGRVEDGKVYSRDFGRCDVKLGREFNLGVKLEDGKGYIYINKVEIQQFNPFYPAVNKVATVLRNNMVATMQVKDLEVCQEVKCVSRAKSGGIIVTKPGDSYKDQGMSECEACTCQLYGHIRCGCSTPEEQGVTCTGGKIAAVGQDCCARCVPPSSTCTASGDPHYNNFDGRGFDFQGYSCMHCAVKTNDFQVNHKNYPGWNRRVSLVEYCQLVFDGDTYNIGRGNLESTTTGNLNTPFKKHYGTETYVYCPHTQNCQVYIANKKMLDVTCRRNYFNIWIHGTYYERTQCMCGYWDGDNGNDFKDRSGKQTSPNAAAMSWVAASNQDNCPDPPAPTDPCDEATRETRNWAHQYCTRYKREPFKSCPLDVGPAYDNCLFDACTNPNGIDAICKNAEAFASDCSEAGHPVVGWRSNSFCPMDCPTSMMYVSCGRGCIPTCSDPSPKDCSESCKEGCYCPPGTVLENGACILPSDCRCLHEGNFKDVGDRWNDTGRCESCTCENHGIIECGPYICSECPSGQVPISREGQCCPICLPDWALEKEDTIKQVEGQGPVVMECMLHKDVLVSPEDITWRDGEGQVISVDSLPDSFSFDTNNLILTIDPASISDSSLYTAEVVYNGVVGQCQFDVEVTAIPPPNFIDIKGESPKEVYEGECQTVSIEVAGDVDKVFTQDDFKWTFGPGKTPIDFSDPKYTLKDGGKTVQICDADDMDEGSYECCVVVDEVTDCVEIQLKVLAVCTSEDNVHKEGDEWMEGDFRKCVCTVQGQIECNCIEQQLDDCAENFETYYDENCELQCARAPATCSIMGDPHYTTFDGHKHDFQGGDCRFTLVETDDFTVVGTNVHRNDKKEVSWNDAVNIFFGGLNLYLGAENKVQVDGEDVFLPYNKVIRSRKAEKAISVIQAGESVIVTLDLGNGLEGLTLIWDGNSTVDATVHGKYFENTKGLCGTWDEDDKNDQSGEEDVNDFGWSWKYTEEGEQCTEQPPKEHPCDDAFWPQAKPIADDSCDFMMDAPFTDCHGLVDITSAVDNCKFDTCACFDPSCACHAIKKYVQDCKAAGVTSLNTWREDFATFCPMECPEHLVYEPCGSYCPPTCADKNPDCGKLAGKCNEGCFCPEGTYLQDGECVAAAECKCMFKGEIKEIGSTWSDKDQCSDCACRDEGEVACEPIRCTNCGKQKLPVFTEGECCPACVKDWLWAKESEITDVESRTALTLTCVAATGRVAKTTWFFSNDDGATWNEVEGAPSRLTLTIQDIRKEDEGIYKCTARKQFRVKSAEIKLTVKDEAAGCVPEALENGSVDPSEMVPVGDKVTYSCDAGFVLTGEEIGECKPDGNFDNKPTCEEPQPVEFVPKYAPGKRNTATFTCSVNNPVFTKASEIKFYHVDAKGDKEEMTSGKFSVKYNKKTGEAIYTRSKVKMKKKPKKMECSGLGNDGITVGSAQLDF